MGMEYSNGQMGPSIKGISEKMLCMGKELTSGVMGGSTKEIE